MRDLVEYITKSLVDDPNAVQVAEYESEDGKVLEITVAPDDMGKVIGKQGRIARTIRTIVKAGSLRTPVRYLVEIV